MDSEKASVLSLTEEEYTAAFITLLASSTEYGLMTEMMKPVVESFKGEPIDLMSIGPGDGCLENDLVMELGLNVSHFHGVEPNEELHTILKQRLVAWENTKFSINTNYFTVNYEEEKKFDLVLMSHCLYSMENVEQIVLKAITFLKPQGRLVIIVHSEIGGAELYFKSMKSVEYLSPPLADESVTRKYVCDILAKNSISFTTTQSPSELDVTHFVKRQDTPTANDVVSFQIQTRFEKLPEELKKELYEMVKERVIHKEDDKYMMPHPTAMIIVQQKC